MLEKNDKKINWPHIGNEHVKEFLQKSVSKKNVNSAFIFNGPDNLGKTTTAHFFSKVLLCEKNKDESQELPCDKCPACLSFGKNHDNENNESEEKEEVATSYHSDFLEIKLEKDKKNISIEQARKFISHLSLSSFFGSYKIGIIKHADKLSREAANALLKTLEEPKKNVVIILITENFNVLPQTIVSRSQVLEFRPVKMELIYDHLIKEFKASRSQAKNIARLSLGRPALAVKFFEDKDFLEAYTLKTKKFIDFFYQDINLRLKNIEEIFGNTVKGQVGVKMAKRILQVWGGVLRDFMLMKINLANIIQHEIVHQELSAYAANIPLKRIPEMFQILEEAEEDLMSNVNPRLVLENVAVRL